MKTFFVLAGVASLVLVNPAVTKVSASIPADVKALGVTESNVVAVLRHYAPTYSWESQFVYAEASQDKDIKRVNADLVAGTIVSDLRGSASVNETAKAESVSQEAKVLAVAESRVVTVLHQYQPTASWGMELLKAEANQGKVLRTINAALVGSLKVPPGETLLDKETAVGSSDVSASIAPDALDIWSIYLVATSTPPQQVFITWSLGCPMVISGNTPQGNNMGQTTVTTPALVGPLQPPGTFTDCIVSAAALIYGAGSVTIKVYD